MPKFGSLKEVESYLKLVYAPYGGLSDCEWVAMATTSSRRCDDGSLTLHYDPKIIIALSEHSQFQCWERWVLLSTSLAAFNLTFVSLILAIKPFSALCWCSVARPPMCYRCDWLKPCNGTIATQTLWFSRIVGMLLRSTRLSR
jgi:hypothetical protein